MEFVPPTKFIKKSENNNFGKLALMMFCHNLWNLRVCLTAVGANITIDI